VAPTIVGLGGSLARASKSRAALERALQGSAAAGAQTRLFEKVVGLISVAGVLVCTLFSLGGCESASRSPHRRPPNSR
jgi:hypothetical protein